jgi:SMODS and SLOG-associating 2TM effector domain 2
MAKFPEDPIKLSEFRTTMQGLIWGAQGQASLDQLFWLVDGLAFCEVEYYYRVRRSRAFWSGTLRIMGLILATVGILCPLMSAANRVYFSEIGVYGYAFLAAAGGTFAANELLGGSSGHIRFVSAQLALEKLITVARVDWASYLQQIAEKPLPDQESKKGFEIVAKYTDGFYSIVLSETGNWSKTLTEALKKFEKENLKSHK